MGTISDITAGSPYRWTNQAGVSWGLTFDPATDVLMTDESNPYQAEADGFYLILTRDDLGNLVGQLQGYSFNCELFTKP